MKNKRLSFFIVFLLGVILITSCAEKKSVAQTEQLLEKNQKPYLLGSGCRQKYGDYPRTYNSYYEFKRCEYKENQ
jgi:hypothetical protein